MKSTHRIPRSPAQELACGNRVGHNSLLDSLGSLWGPLGGFWLHPEHLPGDSKSERTTIFCWSTEGWILCLLGNCWPFPVLVRRQGICLWDFPPLGKSEWFCQDLAACELNPAALKREHRGAGAILSDSKPKLSTSYSSSRFCKC